MSPPEDADVTPAGDAETLLAASTAAPLGRPEASVLLVGVLSFPARLQLVEAMNASATTNDVRFVRYVIACDSLHLSK